MSDLAQEWLAPYFTKDSRRKFFKLASQAAAIGGVAALGTGQAQTTGTGTGTGTTTTTPASDLTVLNFALTLEYLEATFYTYFLGVGLIPTSQLPTGVTAPTSYANLLGTVNGVSPTSASQQPGRGLAPLVPGAFASSTLVGSGLASTLGVGSNLYNLLSQIRDHEVTHVIVLRATITALGGTPVQPCDYNFSSVNSVDAILKTAQALENTGVSAYDGAISLIKTPALLTAGATIATVEARHAAFLNLIAGGGLVTGANFQPSTATPPTGTPPGVSASPFPSAFDTPLSVAQVLAIATPFLGSSCTAPATGTTTTT